MSRAKTFGGRPQESHLAPAITNSTFGDARDVLSYNTFITNNYKDNTVPLLEYLKQYANHDAPYNSMEREAENSILLPGTREKVLEVVEAWAEDNDAARTCWTNGPAGTGKTVIAHTIAETYDRKQRLAFSYFFSRRNRGRNDMSKFIPTLAYKLATTVPSIQPFMHAALQRDPLILKGRRADQLDQLVVQPLRLLPHSAPASLLIVIDGLDEYGVNVDGVGVDDVADIARALQDILRLLVDNLFTPPFRFLFTSRPEAYIQEIFRVNPFKSQTKTILLQDYPVLGDIRRYLKKNLLAVARKRCIATPWPSSRILDDLTKKSEGIFIYASTLVKFVDSEYEHPVDQLRIAAKAHKGLDSLYKQVLGSAKKYRNFEQVLGAVAFLRDRPSIIVLLSLLQLPSINEVKLALRGCLSILIIPSTDDEEDYIRPYHASFIDFLEDPQRGKDHFVKSLEWNKDCVIWCSALIRLNPSDEGHQAQQYAAANWCYHLSLVISNSGCFADFEPVLISSSLLVRDILARLQSWFINTGSLDAVEQAEKELNDVLAFLKVT